jgi:RNA polymerase sigma-70 factor (ECF subfamily)
LEDQDRALWDKHLIDEGTTLVKKALISQRFGPYTIQAAISAVHAAAKNSAATDWNEIVGLYDVLLRFDPSPVVELNRAVAVAMRDGPAAGLTLIESLHKKGELSDYQWLYSAQADLYRRLGKRPEAQAAYQKALKISQLEPEQRFLKKRLAELSN